MKKKSVEIKPVLESFEPLVRDTFRIPVQEDFPAFLRIASSSYPLSDITPDGIGIVVRADSEFSQAQILENCILELAETRISGLTGKIVHCSFDGGKWQCGIKWLNFEQDRKKQIKSIIFRLKKLALDHEDLDLGAG